MVQTALSLRLLSKHSKLHVEAAVLDYDLAIQLSSNLAYAAILTSLQKTSVVEGFHLMDLINWMSTLKSVLAGSRADEIFIKGIGDIVHIVRTTSGRIRERSGRLKRDDSDMAVGCK